MYFPYVVSCSQVSSCRHRSQHWLLCESVKHLLRFTFADGFLLAYKRLFFLLLCQLLRDQCDGNLAHTVISKLNSYASLSFTRFRIVWPRKSDLKSFLFFGVFHKWRNDV